MVNAILEEAGLKTALAGTLRFKIGNDSRPNLYKMTIPGRFFVQSFLRKAVKAGCDWVVLEMTSEGAKQFRHKFIQYDALIFTNLAPEHIESHGSYENYLAAKLSIAEEVACSKKPNRSIIANTDDAEGHKFLSVNVPRKLPYSLKDAEPYFATDNGTEFAWRGERIKSPLPGVFNILNMVGAATFLSLIHI